MAHCDWADEYYVLGWNSGRHLAPKLEMLFIQSIGLRWLFSDKYSPKFIEFTHASPEAIASLKFVICNDSTGGIVGLLNHELQFVIFCFWIAAGFRSRKNFLFRIALKLFLGTFQQISRTFFFCPVFFFFIIIIIPCCFSYFPSTTPPKPYKIQENEKYILNHLLLVQGIGQYHSRTTKPKPTKRGWKWGLISVT